VSTLGRLLEVQALDLEADALLRKRETLPEREVLAGVEANQASLAAESATVHARNEELARAERELSGEVATIAGKAREVEDNLYSGSVTVPKELDGLQQELALLKTKQEEVEERELTLLEQMEEVEGALTAGAAGAQDLAARAEEVRGVLASSEAVIDAEIADLAQRAGGLRADVPVEVLEAYDRLRGNARLAGRAAVGLASKTCSGCQLDMPVLEYSRIRDAPEDALVTCVHCHRLLIR